MRRSLVLAAVFLSLASPARGAVGDADVAALQVGLTARGLYRGPVDGFLGSRTTTAVRRLQQRARLSVDGVPGPQTRSALGRFGQYGLGSRTMEIGMKGWDVAALQFLLAWHGFPSGMFDGEFGERTRSAVVRFQQWAGLPAPGRAGSATLAALQSPPARCPLPLAQPLPRALPTTDGFGPRGRRFHAGVDIPAPYGQLVRAAAPGRVVWAGWRDGGWGNVVTLAHSNGVRTMYAHLSAVDVTLGEWVVVGSALGQVGATGDATGPHLHFEVRLRGAAVDPLPALAG